MDDFNLLATYNEIVTHYQSLDVPIPIAWLLDGRFSEKGDTDMQITFTSGQIESLFDALTGDYDLIRFENGYMMYNIRFQLTDIDLSGGSSNQLLYDVEIPAHFTTTPNSSASYGRTSRDSCVPLLEYNGSHLVDYLPAINLYRTSGSSDTTSGFLNIRMEGF